MLIYCYCSNNSKVISQQWTLKYSEKYLLYKSIIGKCLQRYVSNETKKKTLKYFNSHKHILIYLFSNVEQFESFKNVPVKSYNHNDHNKDELSTVQGFSFEFLA